MCRLVSAYVNKLYTFFHNERININSTKNDMIPPINNVARKYGNLTFPQFAQMVISQSKVSATLKRLTKENDGLLFCITG